MQPGDAEWQSQLIVIVGDPAHLVTAEAIGGLDFDDEEIVATPEQQIRPSKIAPSIVVDQIAQDPKDHVGRKNLDRSPRPIDIGIPVCP